MSALPLARSLSPLAHCARVPRAGAAVPRRAAGPGARAHADQRLPGAAGGAVAGRAARSPIPATASCSTSLAPGCAARVGFADGMARPARVTDMFLTVRARRGARRPPAAHPRPRDRGRQRPRPRRFPPRSRPRAQRDPRRTGRGGRRGRGARGVPPGPAQGLSRTAAAMRDGAGRRAVGGGRAAGLRPRRRTWRPLLRTAGWATGCACWAIATMCRPCWPRPTSSRCPAISRGCRCR